jgi:hypothetical protein
MFQESFYMFKSFKKTCGQVVLYQKSFSLIKCSPNCFKKIVNFNIFHKKGSMCSKHSKNKYKYTFLDFNTWMSFYTIIALVENQVLCHYTFPLKSNFNGIGLVPFHHTLTIVKGSTTMPPSWLPKWNGIHAIPLYNGCSGKECDNATFFTT